MDLAAHRAALLDSCRRAPGVTSLVVFGSSAGAGAGRRDEWSDLDFNLFLAGDAAPYLARDWPFLPHPDQLVLTAHEGENGGVALYADGMLYEFGAGRPWTIRDPDREVLLDGGDLCVTAPDPLPDAAAQVRLFLAKLYIGVGRVRRGERVAGNVHVRAHALACLAEALRQRLAPDAARSPFDPLRRLELALPEVSGRLAALLDADVETCARGLFDLSRELLEPDWPDYPSLAADVIATRLGWA
ncbi:MAG: hypothetical protein KDB60_15340 [Propionibacteriaceae bacterium]|nr:hypothetical protein [Propionibacteriaceae bacterium]